MSHALKSSFAITPEEMAKTCTYLAPSDEVKWTTGAYFDDPSHMVSSSGYSRDREKIEKVMGLTVDYREKEVAGKE